MSLAIAVLLAGLPYVRPMPPIPAVAGQQLVVKCPVAGYPIDTIIWEKGKSLHLSLICARILQQRPPLWSSGQSSWLLKGRYIVLPVRFAILL
jgi:hypothetical protein